MARHQATDRVVGRSRSGLAGSLGRVEGAITVDADVRRVAAIRRCGALLLQTRTHALGGLVGANELGHSTWVWRTETIAALIARFTTGTVRTARFEHPEAS